MKRLKLFLENWGFHALLLPVFFTVHTYTQYYGLVGVPVALKLSLIILLITFLLALGLFAATRHLNRTLQLVTFLSFIFLFFGVIKDFLQFSLHADILAKYVVIIPILIIISIYVIRALIRKNNFKRSNLFQNVLLLLFLLIDISQLVPFSNSSVTKKNLLVKNRYPTLSSIPIRDNRPTVYYLLFDSYPGTSFLRKYMNFDNSEFNLWLRNRGFYVLNDPKSNYNRTAFSIASTLNFDYLKDIRTNKRVSPKDYAQASFTIENALVPQFFKQQKYSFYNLSVFDIDKVPSIRKETFLTMPEEDIFLYNTLTERLKNDLFWNLLTGKYAIPFFQNLFTKSQENVQKEQMQKNAFNQIVIDSILKGRFNKSATPKFIYAHFYLPHPPFFYDEFGKENDIKYVTTEASLKDKNLFLSYLKYTNKIIEKIVDTIYSNSEKKPVIIIQSDHGFRDYVGGPSNPECFFMNYSAFYFPDKDYSTLYDTMSNINTFPIIFNKYFNTSIPLRRDSTIFLAN